MRMRIALISTPYLAVPPRLYGGTERVVSYLTDELVHQVADDLHSRYGLDDADMRALGSRLAEAAGARSGKNLELAKHFTEEHRERFDRLAE